MKREYSDIRLTASCKFWLLETVADNYESLKRLAGRLDLKAQEMKTARSKKARIGADPGPITRTPKLTSSVGRKERLPTSNIPTTSPSSPNAERRASQDASQPAVATITIGLIDALGCTMLWRASLRWKAAEFYDSVTQTINLNAMVCRPGDFNFTRSVVYWTPQKETADRYAAFYKHKARNEDIVIIQIAVPETFIRTLTIRYLWIDERQALMDEWRKFVWSCRGSKALTSELRYLDSKGLFIGHIASEVNRKFEQMANYTEIEERHVLKVLVDNVEVKAIQWVFNTYLATDGVEDHCKGRVWVHSIGALKVPSESPAT